MDEAIEQIPGGRSLLKAILQAVAILAVTAALAQAVLFPRIQGQLLESVQRWEVEYLNGGTIELLADELNAIDPAEWRSWVEAVSVQFGFNVSLQDLASIRLEGDSRARLLNHEAVGDPSDYSLFKLLSDGERVLVFSDTKTPADHLVTEAQRRNMGTLAMLERRLASLPEWEWSREIDTAGAYFGYPVALAAESDLTLSATGIAALE